MKIYFFCPRWGAEHIPWKEFCRQVSSAGYSGIESPIPVDNPERDEMKNSLEQYGLLFIGQYYQSFEKDFQTHLLNYKQHLQHMQGLNCVLIDSQTGKDYFSTEQNIELFQAAETFSLENGITVAHETHRNKALYAAHRFGELATDFPTLKITADFSHWCCVSESLLEQQPDVMELAISKTVHIHARVGNEESPQVADPRAPEFERAFAAHLHWWDKIVLQRQEQGNAQVTITPEFGPPPYMPNIPFTKTPVANQWELNLFMMECLKKRYNC
mgnify:CR=1 FL=1